MTFVARYGRRAGILAEEDPVSLEAVVHDGPRVVRVQRPAKTDHLVVDERIHRIEDERSDRGASGLAAALRPVSI